MEERILQLGEAVVKYDDKHLKLHNSKVPLTSSYTSVKQAAGRRANIYDFFSDSISAGMCVELFL